MRSIYSSKSADSLFLFSKKLEVVICFAFSTSKSYFFIK